jgi:hypothetical protein
MGGGKIEVRIDSGDRRVSSGLFSMSQRSVAGRERIMAAAKELGIPAEWHAVRHAPSDSDGGRWRLYQGIAFWLDAEPGLGKKMLSDAADYFRHPWSYDSLPRSAGFCFELTWDEERQKMQIDEHQCTNPEVLQAELDAAGYVPEPGELLSRLLKGEAPN